MQPHSHTDRNLDASGSYRSLHDAFLRADAEPAGALESLLAAQPDFIAAHLLAIAKAVAAKDAAAFPALRAALEAVQRHAHRADERERMHLAAAEAWLQHRPLHAAHIYSTISAQAPDDLLALRLAQSCWFFLGRRSKVRAVAEQAMRTLPRQAPGYDIALAMFAFGLVETGDAVRSEACARESLLREPRSPFALHVLLHALGAQGRCTDGGRILLERQADWRIGGRLESHIAWHLAVCELQAGHVKQALHSLDAELLPAAALSASNAVDATDLAWRLELAGADTRPLWQRLADAWHRHVLPGFWDQHDVLAGLAYHRAGERGRLHSLRRRLEAGPYPRVCALRTVRRTTLPALRAVEAFAHGAFEIASSALRTALQSMGGSLLQCELFSLMLSESDRRHRLAYARWPAADRIPA
jgi:hypothetical protein